MIGMYDKLIELNGKVDDMFYVGDAAGRKNDHSYADINFAYSERTLPNSPLLHDSETEI